MVRLVSQVRALKAGGAVIGLLPHTTYEEASLTLSPGDLLVLYTDGFSGAMTATTRNGRGADVGCGGSGSLPSRQTRCSRSFEAADRFTQGAPQQDDMTLLTLKINAV